MNGTVPGRMMLTSIFSSDAPKLRATFRNRASLVFTPDWVLMMIGMTAPRKTTTTFDQMPMPNQMMMSGNNVTRGTAFERVDERTEQVLQRAATSRWQARSECRQRPLPT